MQPARSICVIEDDPAIRRGLVDSLTFAGFTVHACADGDSARRTLAHTDLDLVLLDVVLPGLDGIEYLPTLRAARPTLPVILVTARGAEEDRVRGLQNGADDYVVKPFSSTELLARVEAVLRRSPARPSDVRTLIFAGGRVEFERREIVFDSGDKQQLTDREAALLAYLARNDTRAIERAELLSGVWGLDPRGVDTRTIDMAVVRLREKLGVAGGDIVCTVRGKGYMLGQGLEVQR
ncbi:MAG: response regulator transcription factor [Planctomycetes bacterium]|nr:response regulator transcription factor [Planctomycetota bacterium]